MDSPAVILYDASGTALAVLNGVAIPANTPALMVAGSDGTDSHYLVVDSSGRPVVVGAGTAGSSVGGVLSVQGVGSGTPIPISGSITATNGSVGTLGAAIPASGTQIGASDGTNLQVPRAFDADSGGGSQYVLGVNLRGSASGGSIEIGTDSDPVKIDPTGDTTQPVGGVGSGAWAPSPLIFNGISRSQKAPLSLGPDGSLQCYSAISTDLGTFRDDFTALTRDLTGTVTFTNGSTVVTGSGCYFTQEVDRLTYLRLSTHDDSVYALVLSVTDDNNLTLATVYTGANGSGTAKQAHWHPVVGTGGTIGASSSELTITSGTTSGQNTYLYHKALYAPLQAIARCKISQRIANQTAKIGFYDNPVSPNAQVSIELSGTDNTKITLCAKSSSGVSDLETYTVTLPFGLTTDNYLNIAIEYQPEIARFWYDPLDGTPRTLLGSCRVHLPNTYTPLLGCLGIFNTGVPASDTTATVDYIYRTNYNLLNIHADSGVINPQAACTPISAAVADTTLLVTNNGRIGACIFNNSVSICYVKLGTGASPTSFTVRLPSNGYYEVPYGYRGQINGYWLAATGTAQVTELA